MRDAWHTIFLVGLCWRIPAALVWMRRNQPSIIRIVVKIISIILRTTRTEDAAAHDDGRWSLRCCSSCDVVVVVVVVVLDILDHMISCATAANVCPSPRAILGGSSSQMSGSHRASMCSSTRKHVVMWGLRTPWVRRLCTKRYATRAIFALCQIPVKTPDRCQNEARGAPRAPRLSVMNLCQNMMHACIPRVNIQ